MNYTTEEIPLNGRKVQNRRPNPRSERVDDIFMVCSDEIFRKRHDHNYEVTVLNRSTVEVQCFLNYHRVSGHHYRHCLVDGQWTGEELHCEVDYYKERYRLSLFIILVTAFLALTFLGIDFGRHLKRRVNLRSHKRRLAMYKLKKTFQYEIQKGHSQIKLNQLQHLHYLTAVSESYNYNPLKITSSLVANKDSFMGAFGFRSRPQAPKQESVQNTSTGTSKRFERGMFLFRMRNSAFTHADVEPGRGST